MISLGREWIERDSTRLAQYRTNTIPSYQDRERQRGPGPGNPRVRWVGLRMMYTPLVFQSNSPRSIGFTPIVTLVFIHWFSSLVCLIIAIFLGTMMKTNGSGSMFRPTSCSPNSTLGVHHVEVSSNWGILGYPQRASSSHHDSWLSIEPNVIIPTDELIFFRGVAQPPTTSIMDYWIQVV